MKFFKTAFISSFIIVTAFTVLSLAAQSHEIHSGVFRLHIRACDNSTVAQKVKIDVRDAVLDYTANLVADAKNAKQAEEMISANLDSIKMLADSVLENNNCTYTAAVYVSDEHFPTRTYDDVSLPCGNYSALVIDLGYGAGENWWCMLYPRLCAGNSDTGDITDAVSDDTAATLRDSTCYKFKVLEILGTIF